MSTPSYNKIRMIGYAIPTTPAEVVSIGDPNGPGAVAGYYLANDDFATDITSRVKIMKCAVDSARAKLPSGESGVINLFVVPEFYFHGTSGPYIHDSDANDPVIAIRELLAATFNQQEYPDWMFVCGSIITTRTKDMERIFTSQSVQSRNNVVATLAKEWQNSFGPLKGVLFDMLVNFIKVCHSYPNCEVRNRSVIINNMGINVPQGSELTTVMVTEKYYVSNEDFLLYDTQASQRIVTEQMTAYPVIDLSGGDAKQSPFDEYAIFRQGIATEKAAAMDYGVEICLDHSDTRLRCNIDNEPEPIVAPHVQVIPSCGMQIVSPSVAVDANGFVFNCDGQYALNSQTSGQAVLNDVDSLFANYHSGDYAAHTQLACISVPATGRDPNAPGSTNACYKTLTPDAVQCISPINPPVELADYYAGGAGEIHIYGLENPFTLYP